MLAAGSLAALMKEWPLNSVILFAVTHSKLRKSLDGTGTQVVTCMINRWTVKMNGVEGYMMIEVSQRRGPAKRSQFWGFLKALTVKHWRLKKKKNSSSDTTRGQAFTPSLRLWPSCFLAILSDRWRSPH